MNGGFQRLYFRLESICCCQYVVLVDHFVDIICDQYKIFQSIDILHNYFGKFSQNQGFPT